MTRIAIPGALVLLVVLGFVTAAGWNARVPVVRLTLTERELWLQPSGATPGDESILRLSLVTQRRDTPLDSRNWLTADRLRGLGFDLRVPPGTSVALEHYQRELPRVVWVAFQYDGDAYRAIERSRELLREAAPSDMPDAIRHPDMDPGHRGSRLVPVDASLEFETLATRYEDEHLILRAVVTLQIRREGAGYLAYGVLRELIPTAVSVPRHLRPVLEALPRSPSGSTPRYEVDLGVGRLGIPFILDIRAL